MDLSYEAVMERYEKDRQIALNNLTPEAHLIAEYLNRYKKGRINLNDLDRALNKYGFSIDLKECKLCENMVPHISTLVYTNKDKEILSFDCYLDVGIRCFSISKNNSNLCDFDFQ